MSGSDQQTAGGDGSTSSAPGGGTPGPDRSERLSSAEADSPDGVATGTGDRPADALPYDTVFELLSNERRRFTLRYLDRNGPTSLGELAEELAAYENDKPRPRITSRERKRTYVGLYQCHLPKLEAAGVIDSDRSLHIELGPTAPQLLRYVNDDRDRSDPGAPGPPIYFPTAAAAITGTVGIGLWLLFPVSPVGPIAVAGAFMTVLAIAGADLTDRSAVPSVGSTVVERVGESIQRLGR